MKCSKCNNNMTLVLKNSYHKRYKCEKCKTIQFSTVNKSEEIFHISEDLYKYYINR